MGARATLPAIISAPALRGAVPSMHPYTSARAAPGIPLDGWIGAAMTSNPTIICGTSALAFWRTPPAIRDVQLPTSCLDELKPRFHPRANTAPEAMAVVDALAGPLKGVAVPVHVLGADGRRSSSPYVIWHTSAREPAKSQLVQIGDDLYVTSPELTLLHLAHRRSFAATLQLAYEFCGLYSTLPLTSRLLEALTLLEEEGELPSTSTALAAFYDAQGSPRTPCPGFGPWEIGRKPDGSFDDLWRRPPLTTPQSLLELAEALQDGNGVRTLRAASRAVLPGSGSPLETEFCILAFTSKRRGGAGLPAPLLNQAIELPPEVARTVRMTYVVPDCSWTSERALPQSNLPLLPFCLELEGLAYHSGEAVAADAQRRTALQRLGIDTIAVTRRQLLDLDRWLLLLDVLSERLGVPAQTEPSDRHQRQRTRLREELFAQRRD